MVVGLLRGLPEVTGLVTVCSLDCWELPSANQHSFKHFTVFPDLLPTDVLCLGRVASDLGKEAGAAELRQGEGVLVSHASSSVLSLRSGGGLQRCPLWHEVEGKELSSLAQMEEGYQAKESQ